MTAIGQMRVRNYVPRSLADSIGVRVFPMKDTEKSAE